MSDRNIPEYKEYKALLSKRLNEKRYYHSLCVADEAYRLAERYGASKEKAYLAGLLHDITKNSPVEEHLNIFDTFGIMLSDIEKSTVKLWHAISGAAFVRYILNIDDEEIIEAIRCHTTAKAYMSPLDKVLYLADFTSRDRDYDDVDVMRKLVDESMESALTYALKYTIADLIDRDRAVHPDTFAAYNQIMMERK